jgi:hypothetical protein
MKAIPAIKKDNSVRRLGIMIYPPFYLCSIIQTKHIETIEKVNLNLDNSTIFSGKISPPENKNPREFISGLIPFLNLKRKQKKELLLFFTNFGSTMSRRYFFTGGGFFFSMRNRD